MTCKKLCLFFLCLLTLRQAAATTYYVDSRRGNDQHQGTFKGRALKSLAKVNALSLAPGDAVLFRRGTTYQGQLKISGRGKPGQMIYFGSYGSGDKPRIEGKGEYPETVLIYNAEYLKFENFEITNLGPERKPHRMGLHIQLQDFGIA